MSHLGVTPTIQTLKEFEGIASLEEVTDGTFGALTAKLGTYTVSECGASTFQWGAYMLPEVPKAPMPEMAQAYLGMTRMMLHFYKG